MVNNKTDLTKLDKEVLQVKNKKVREQEIKQAVNAREDIKQLVAMPGWQLIEKALNEYHSNYMGMALRGSNEEERERARLTMLSIEDLVNVLNTTINYEAPEES